MYLSLYTYNVLYISKYATVSNCNGSLQNLSISSLCEVIRLVKSELGNALFGNKDIWKRLEVAAAESLRWAKICRGKPSPLDLCIGQRNQAIPLAYGSHFFWGIRRQQEKRERSSFWQVIVLEAWPTCANGCVACHPFHRHNWHQAHWLELSRPVWLWMALASLLLAYTTRFLGPESSDSLTLVAPFFCNDAAPETVIAGLEVPHQIDTCHIRSWGDITARNQFINQDVEVTNPCKPS